MSNRTTIIGIQISKRSNNAPEIQNLFTSYGCSIRTRIGLHESTFEDNSASGLVLLEAIGNPDEIHQLKNKLSDIDGVTVKSMEFTLD